MGMAGGAVWLLTHPAWLILSPQQVTVEGNRLLPDDKVRSLLEIDYPKALWQLSSDAIAHQLESKGIIAQAVVTRHLFPPSLTIEVKERDPVAIALLAPASPGSTDPNATTSTTTGLLDATGFLVPMDENSALEAGLTLPSLRVIGFRPEQQDEWASFYRDLSQHQQQFPGAIAIQEIDWRNASNLILRTELGLVHLGGYDSRLPKQLRALDQLRQLPTQINLSQVIYIDLQNPDKPLLQTRDTRSFGTAPATAGTQPAWEVRSGENAFGENAAPDAEAQDAPAEIPVSPDVAPAPAIPSPAINAPAAW
ncbi:MAG: hypothetical protein Fur0046_15090 [Cyanobacteria bacterium J069]